MTTAEELAKLRKKEMNFAESVHQLVSELSEVDPTMIRWTSDGAAFVVNSMHPGLGGALAKYFQHSKYSSFQRQLNQYGWTKPRSGRYNGTFYNPSFSRDTDIEEVRKISRGGCKKHLRNASETENVTPQRRKSQKSHKKATIKAVLTQSEEDSTDPSTPSPYRRRARLPLQKRPVNFSVAKTVSPLTPKSIENPSGDDMTAAQVLLGMVQKPSSSDNAAAEEESMVSTSEVTSKSVARSKNFAKAVHELVTEADATNPTMIRWVEDGSAFEMNRSHPDLGDALAKYFHHSKYSSFQRQLNQYGWCKVRNTGKFFNKYFHQEKSKSNFDLIQRKDKKADVNSLMSRGTKRASITSSEKSMRTLDADVEYSVSMNNNHKRRKRESSYSEPRLQPVSDEETISSEEGSILAQNQTQVSFVDLTRPPSNVTAYHLPHHSR